ncbi:hypothetical protein WN51_05918 [Melipona quadrifasciata]|uniref:Uncharacterized protein n=1 Tax=Melipona quadrifasciata TaxID=166423 RepID=A0A0M9A654_9HYME|nr:hypothetical protein WN51_05918 [Melipona quadrifasciata]
MPRKHQVHKLVDLALHSIGEFVTIFGRSLTKYICIISKTNPEYGHTKLHSMLEFMKHLLSYNIPRNLYDKMSRTVLTAIVNLVKETRGTYNDYALTTTFLSEITVALHLTEVVVDTHLRMIEFSAWPKIMRHILYNKLPDMVGLEVLDLGSGSAGWRTSDIEKVIINGITAMPNLVCFILCFDCTDNIIAALAQNCKKLQKLDVTASKSVTERSIAPLLSCKYLKEIKLCKTSVTVSGYATLFLEHLNIEDIDDNLCPSSVAAWFHKYNYNVSLCQQTFSQRIEYSLPIPIISDESDNDKFFEWLGVLSICGNLYV